MNINVYFALGTAIVLEVAGTTLLKLSDGLTKPLAATGALLSFGVCLYFLSLALRVIPTGIAYAIWSGAGIVLVSLIGWVFLKQRLDLPAIVGIGLILCGVLVLNLLSRSTVH